MTPASHRSIESKLIWSITLSTIVSSPLPGKTCCYEASVPVWMLRSCRLDLLWRQSQVTICCGDNLRWQSQVETISGLWRWPIFCWWYPAVRRLLWSIMMLILANALITMIPSCAETVEQCPTAGELLVPGGKASRANLEPCPSGLFSRSEFNRTCCSSSLI